MKIRTTMVAAAVGLAMAGSAAADVIFTLGNNPQPGEENILFNGPGTTSGPALTVTGRTNNSDLLVDFTSDENLVTPARGQARIEAVDGDFTTLTFNVETGTFGDFILNPIMNPTTGRPVTGTVDVTVNLVNEAPQTFSYTVSSGGNNFVTITTANGERISSINIASGTGISFFDLQQPRISTATSCPPGSENNPLCNPIPSVPEPGVLSLIGLALSGMAAMRRRKQS